MVGMVGSMTAISLAKAAQSTHSSVSSSSITMQAQTYATSEAELIKAKDYSDLQTQSRAVITGSDFQKEVILSAESDYSSSIKQKTATIKVFKGNEVLPRASLNLTRYSVEQKTGDVPVGTIIAWASWRNPMDGTWLDCNGQSCAAYPELVNALGSNNVPDYRNRFLEGSSSPGIYIDAGLPNIWGSIVLRRGNEGSYPQGVFSYGRTGDNGYKGGGYGEYGTVDFNAARFNAIYGRSSTVQPPAVTVRWLIKAA